MRKLLLVPLTALFAAATFSAHSADQTAQPATTAPPVQQSGKTSDESGRGAPQSSGTGTVEQGGNAPGRGDPTGTTPPGGAVTSPTPTGPGRGDNQ